jgi:hypothetical protein
MIEVGQYDGPSNLYDNKLQKVIFLCFGLPCLKVFCTKTLARLL